jgi:hypothetical protein
VKRVRRAPSAEISDPYVVECRLCHKEFRAIGWRHLRKAHDYKGDHPVEEYKRSFGLEKATCRATRRAIRRSREDYWEDRGQHWTRKRLVESLRKKARAGEPLAHGRLSSQFSQALRRHFGTWEKAIRRAGLDPRSHRLIRRWDKRRIVAAIAERQAGGKALSASRVIEEDGDLYRATIRLFGNWRRALVAAGLDPAAHRAPRKWSVGVAQTWVRATAKNGTSLLSSKVPAGLRDAVEREVPGGWADFVESLGIPYPGQRHRTDWSADVVLAEIRGRRRAGKPLNFKAVARGGQALTQQARKYFGTWDAALRAAGVNPLSVRLSRPWTREDVLHGILTRHAAGRPMDFGSARADEPRLVKAAQKAFPSSWGKALAAAGLAPRPPRGPALQAPRAKQSPRRRPPRGRG